MEMQNITLALPKKVLREVKLIAVKRQKSISGMLTEALEEIVSRENRYEQAKQRHLALLERGMNLGTNGKTDWSRADLHDR